jgi:hypothetical protein
MLREGVVHVEDEGFDPIRILAGLRAHGVRSVVVGGLAAQVHGVIDATDDVDVVVDVTEDNLDRLTRALEQLGARPLGSEVEDGDVGRESFETAAGRLDLVELPTERFVALEGDAELVDLGRGVRIHVVRPERLADLSKEAGDLEVSVRLAAMAAGPPSPGPGAPLDESDELSRDDDDVPEGRGGRLLKALADVDRRLAKFVYG